jgi:hypothetical protein
MIANFSLSASPRLGNVISSYAMIQGTMPWGLQINAANGVISGSIQDLTPAIDPSQYTRPPVWRTNGNLATVSDGATLTVPLDAVSPVGSGLTYTWVGGQLPSGSTIEGSQIVGTAATDGFSGSDLTAETRFAPYPTWNTGTSLGSFNEGATANIALSVSPNLGNAITSYSVVRGTLPWGLQVNAASGTLTGSIQDMTPAIDPIELRGAPIWTTSANLSAVVDGATLAIPLAATSPVGSAITFTWVGGQLPSGTTIDGALLTGNATTDAFIGTDTTPETSIAPKPVWASNANLGTASEGGSVSFTLSAMPQSGNTVTYSLVDGVLPIGALLMATTGTVAGTINDTTPYLDPRLVPNPPTWITPAGSLGVFANTASLALTVSASPATGRVIDNYNLDGVLPYGSVFDPETGTITGTLDANSAATIFNFSIRSRDTSGAFADRSFSISVQ